MTRPSSSRPPPSFSGTWAEVLGVNLSFSSRIFTSSLNTVRGNSRVFIVYLPSQQQHRMMKYDWKNCFLIVGSTKSFKNWDNEYTEVEVEEEEVETSKKNEGWVSYVEIQTYEAPHRCLWMGPQFCFRTVHVLPSSLNNASSSILPDQTGINQLSRYSIQLISNLLSLKQVSLNILTSLYFINTKTIRSLQLIN